MLQGSDLNASAFHINDPSSISSSWLHAEDN